LAASSHARPRSGRAGGSTCWRRPAHGGGWAVGGSAAPAAPPVWAADADDAELRLVALAGQFLDAGIVAEPVGALRPRPDLPRLALPTIRETLRPLVRRCLGAAREPAARADLLWLLARRGWSIHPGDWLPDAGDAEAPDLYAPWRDWAADGAAVAPADLTSENWDQWGPAARRVAFAKLRRHDPDAARVLLEAKLTGLVADERVRLVEALATRLSDADAPLLASLGADRARRIQTLAARLLARLGRHGDASEDAAELADFFAVGTRGLLRRRRALEMRVLRTDAQLARLGALMERVDLGRFAAALNVTPAELVALWPWSEARRLDELLLEMVERSAPDDVVAAAFEAALAIDGLETSALLALDGRLDDEQRVRGGERLLAMGLGGLNMANRILRARFDLDGSAESRAARELMALFPAGDMRTGGDELRLLGLLASRAAARRALEQAAAAGLLAADPRLDTLRLNAALDSSGAYDDR
jgi:hypothetical protein